MMIIMCQMVPGCGGGGEDIFWCLLMMLSADWFVGSALSLSYDDALLTRGL